MSQNTSRQHTSATPEDEEEAAYPPPRRPTSKEQARPSHPVAHPPDTDENPDDPDEPAYQLIGDNDLGPADLGPAAPGAPNPDLAAEPPREIPR